MADWAGERVGLHSSDPGRPGVTATSSRSIARVRDRCLNIKHVWSLTRARVVISGWKEDYKEPY